MLTLPNKLFFAIEAVLYIAYNAGQGPVSSKEIADRQSLPPRYLEQMMQKLVRDGMLRGVRGPRGGYLLARERRRVTLADICDALAEEEDALPESATPLGNSVVRPALTQARTVLMGELRNVTIADLCDQAATKRIARRSDERMDFAI